MPLIIITSGRRRRHALSIYIIHAHQRQVHGQLACVHVFPSCNGQALQPVIKPSSQCCHLPSFPRVKTESNNFFSSIFPESVSSQSRKCKQASRQWGIPSILAPSHALKALCQKQKLLWCCADVHVYCKAHDEQRCVIVRGKWTPDLVHLLPLLRASGWSELVRASVVLHP